MFALLVARANRLVTVHDLVDELWPDAPPRSAIANVRTYAANLRRSLGSGADDEARIVREPGGYRLLIDEKLIDLHRLNVRSRRARELMREGRSAQAVPVLVEVVGAAAPLLAGLAVGPALTAQREAVSQERQAALELLTEAYLDLGRPESAVSLLRDHVSHQPLRERAQCLLMRALIQTGDAGAPWPSTAPLARRCPISSGCHPARRWNDFVWRPPGRDAGFRNRRARWRRSGVVLISAIGCRGR
ncbi:AfsR/SARP family transcriptional regulator [Micromonospora aurantiaca (nom. illeg.)]